jgi:hypothetical protein
MQALLPSMFLLEFALLTLNAPLILKLFSFPPCLLFLFSPPLLFDLLTQQLRLQFPPLLF